MFAAIGDALADGKEVRIVGFGIFGTRSSARTNGHFFDQSYCFYTLLIFLVKGTNSHPRTNTGQAAVVGCNHQLACSRYSMIKAIVVAQLK